MTDQSPGAILTPSMREFYRETPEDSGSKARSIRQRTRKRFVATLEDVDLLFGTLRDEDRRAIMDEIPAQELDKYLEKFVALFARELDTGRFEGIIQRGIQRALALKGYPAAEVFVTIRVDRRPADISETIAKLERGEEITNEELIAVFFAEPEDVPEEEIRTLLEIDSEMWNELGKRLEQGIGPYESQS